MYDIINALLSKAESHQWAQPVNLKYITESWINTDIPLAYLQQVLVLYWPRAIVAGGTPLRHFHKIYFIAKRIFSWLDDVLTMWKKFYWMAENIG